MTRSRWESILSPHHQHILAFSHHFPGIRHSPKLHNSTPSYHKSLVHPFGRDVIFQLLIDSEANHLHTQVCDILNFVTYIWLPIAFIQNCVPLSIFCFHFPKTQKTANVSLQAQIITYRYECSKNRRSQRRN